MVCPKCGGRSKIIKSLPVKRQNWVRRRRGCTRCPARWTTYEGIIADEPAPIPHIAPN